MQRRYEKEAHSLLCGIPTCAGPESLFKERKQSLCVHSCWMHPYIFSWFCMKSTSNEHNCKPSSRRFPLSNECKWVCVFLLHLTYVDSPTEALHEQQDEHMKRNQVDYEHITTPSRNLSKNTFNEPTLINSKLSLMAGRNHLDYACRKAYLHTYTDCYMASLSPLNVYNAFDCSR